jgi:hypothetical protein
MPLVQFAAALCMDQRIGTLTFDWHVELPTIAHMAATSGIPNHQLGTPFPNDVCLPGASCALELGLDAVVSDEIPPLCPITKSANLLWK